MHTACLNTYTCMDQRSTSHYRTYYSNDPMHMHTSKSVAKAPLLASYCERTTVGPHDQYMKTKLRTNNRKIKKPQVLI